MGVERGKADCFVPQEDERLGRRENVKSTAGSGRKAQTMANHNDLDIVTAVDMNRCLHRAKDKSAIPALLNGHGSAKEQESENTVSRKDRNQDFFTALDGLKRT